MFRTLINDLLAWLGFRAGQSAGEAQHRAADIEAANVTAQKITRAEADGPADRAAVARELRDHDAEI